MLLKFFISVLFVFSQLLLSAQADSILSFPDNEQPFVLINLFPNLFEGNDQPFAKVNLLQKDLESRKEIELAQLLWRLKHDAGIFMQKDDAYDTILSYHEAAAAESESKDWPLVTNEISFMIGKLHFDHGFFGHGMEMMMHSYNLAHREGWSSLIAQHDMLAALGHSYYRFGDIETAIYYLRDALKVPIPPTCRAFPYKTQNTLGLCYQAKEQYDSAVHFLTLSHTYAIPQKDSFWMALTNGNIGHAYFKSGEYERALPFVESDYKGSIRAGQYGSAVNASALLANIELKKGNVQKANEYLQFAATHLDTTSVESMTNYYENLFHYNKQLGDETNAVRYADLYLKYKARKDKYLDMHVLNQAKMKVAIAQYDNNIKLLEAARSRQVIMRNGLLIILLLGGLTTFMWIKRMQAKRQADLKELDSAQHELMTFTRSLRDKNELIQSFKLEIEQMKNQGQLREYNRSIHLGELMNSNLLTDEDWKRFRQLFDVVHPGFLVRVKEKFSDLTPSEMRLLALVKLQLPSRDMAEMLGISSESIYKTRYRLRKKINLPEDGSLEEVVAMI